MLLVTGGAGFIGANFVLDWLAHSAEPVVNVDKLTYAANLGHLGSVANDSRYTFVQGDIADAVLLQRMLEIYRPRAIVHMAAETHVDRSIEGPISFVHANVVGTCQLLEAVHRYWRALHGSDLTAFRFLHVSTDEVYGSLCASDAAFTEHTPYAPNSPYAASKAASDHFVRAYHQTYGLPVLTVHCSNNYGPFQYPEKLIPLLISNALAGLSLPIYGDGRQVRDWLYVEDHCTALRLVLEKGQVGETYNVGGGHEMMNLDVACLICDILDELAPRAAGGSYREQIAHVEDRPGHDRRYAIDTAKISRELGWAPKQDFREGIRKTVMWCLSHRRANAAV